MNMNAQLQFADAADASKLWQIPDAETLRIKDDSTFRYAVVAVAFGLLFGVTIAATAGSTMGPSAPFSTVSADASTAPLASPQVMKSTPAAPANTAKSVPVLANRKANAGPAAASLPAAVKTTVLHKSFASHHRRSSRRAFVVRASFSRHPSMESPKATSAPAPPPFTVETSQSAPASYGFFTEGDATVADFDASTGMIETDQGKTFLIDKSAGDSYAGPWQDYHRNVHYRCDQMGNCTISGAGVVVPNARLT
jgi:hypothetical protein